MSEHQNDVLEAGHADGVDSEPCMLDAGCVRIAQVEPNLCPDCGDETKKTVTHVVWFDMLNNGQDTGLMEGCLVCCTEFADRLRASLPKEQPE